MKTFRDHYNDRPAILEGSNRILRVSAGTPREKAAYRWIWWVWLRRIWQRDFLELGILWGRECRFPPILSTRLSTGCISSDRRERTSVWLRIWNIIIERTAMYTAEFAGMCRSSYRCFSFSTFYRITIEFESNRAFWRRLGRSGVFLRLRLSLDDQSTERRSGLIGKEPPNRELDGFDPRPNLFINSILKKRTEKS